jgi:hypothetical protein
MIHAPFMGAATFYDIETALPWSNGACRESNERPSARAADRFR